MCMPFPLKSQHRIYILTFPLRTGGQQKKNEIERKLSSGQKVMVVSSYQTLGAGQNIQYKIPKNYVEEKDYIAINELDYSDNEKDFDCC